MKAKKSFINGKRVLVTGGSGSFGKLFIDYILSRYSPKEVIVFSRDENKQGEMKREYLGGGRIRFVLGDVRDYRSVNEVLREVDIVIHAAALKWITEVEYNVWQGIQTNIYGMQNIIEASRNHNVQKVVALSTDKAADPINAYGMTKSLQERLVTTSNLYSLGVKTRFISTRYGNVLGSRGSVVPLFKKLIEEGKPLTVTDSGMTRFIMTLKESVELVLTALEKGVGGEIFVKNMPAHTVGDLAEVMIEASKKDVRIKDIGIRPGEKIHETLITKQEASRTVNLGNYFVILPQIEIPALEMRYKRSKKLVKGEFTSQNTKRLKKKDLRSLLQKGGFI